MENRIEKLPKSSQYYMDLATLIDGRVTLILSEGVDGSSKNKKHDSTRKMALSFI